MEALVCGQHTMMLNSSVVEGESYDFLRVGFAPTYNHPLRHIFHLCLNYYVFISPYTLISNPQRTIWIPSFPRTLHDFEEVYRQAMDIFAGI
jgi:hypothetical protein